MSSNAAAVALDKLYQEHKHAELALDYFPSLVHRDSGALRQMVHEALSDNGARALSQHVSKLVMDYLSTGRGLHSVFRGAVQSERGISKRRKDRNAAGGFRHEELDSKESVLWMQFHPSVLTGHDLLMEVYPSPHLGITSSSPALKFEAQPADAKQMQAAFDKRLGELKLHFDFGRRTVLVLFGCQHPLMRQVIARSLFSLGCPAICSVDEAVLAVLAQLHEPASAGAGGAAGAGAGAAGAAGAGGASSPRSARFAPLNEASTTALVVDVGSPGCCAVPVVALRVEHAAVEWTPAGADLVLASFQLEMRKQGLVFDTQAELEVLTHILSMTGHIELDEKEKKQRPKKFPQYELPDGKLIEVGNGRLDCPAALFAPASHVANLIKAAGGSSAASGPATSSATSAASSAVAAFGSLPVRGLTELCMAAVSHFPPDVRTRLLSNVIVTGPKSKIPGLTQRLELELKAASAALAKQEAKRDKRKLPPPPAPHVHSSFRSWLPQSVDALLATPAFVATAPGSVSDCWLTQAEYDQVQAGVDCFSNFY